MASTTRPNDGSESNGRSDRVSLDEWKEGIESRLKVLYEKDKKWAVAFAVRQSLKVFPLLASKGNFDLWNKKDRCRHLLAIHWANETSLGYLSHQDLAAAYANANAAARAAYAAAAAEDYDAFGFLAARTAAQAAAAAAEDAAYTYGANAAAAADAYAYAAYASDAANAYAYAQAVRATIEAELRQLESGILLSDYLSSPLWQQATSEVDAMRRVWELSFKPAVQLLIQAQSADSRTVAALEKMIQDYEFLLRHGVPEIKPIAVQVPESTRVRKDELGRDPLVRSLAELITHRGNNEHSTIGLLGDWGIGKTGVLELLRSSLGQSSECEVVFGEFNAWSYEHCGNLQAGIAHEAISALSSPSLAPLREGVVAKSWTRLRNALDRASLIVRFAWKLHRHRFVWLVSLAGASVASAVWGAIQLTGSTGQPVVSQPLPVVGIAGALAVLAGLRKPLKEVLAQACTKELRTYLNLPDYQKDLGTIPVMRKQIKALCEVRLGKGDAPPGKKERRFVFVIDDLDRCGHSGIVRTFEAVRLVMDIPRVTVLIAVDQRIALAALALHYKDLAPYRDGVSPLCIARDYLAKMIHLPIRLTVPDESSTRAFLQSQWKRSEEEEIQNMPWFAAHLETEDSAAFPAENAAAVKSAIPTESGEMGAGSEASVGERALTEGDLAQSILDVSLDKILPRPEDAFGLSDEQKACYYWWSKEFHLRNPRQMKRILNSYNLLRLLLRKRPEDSGPLDDPKLDAVDVGGGKAVPVFPVLLALVLLEYLNDLPDANRRDALRRDLLGGEESETWCHQEHRSLAEGATRLGLCEASDDQEVAARALLDFVDPFVLPALEKGAAFEPGRGETRLPTAGTPS